MSTTKTTCHLSFWILESLVIILKILILDKFCFLATSSSFCEGLFWTRILEPEWSGLPLGSPQVGWVSRSRKVFWEPPPSQSSVPRRRLRCRCPTWQRSGGISRDRRTSSSWRGRVSAPSRGSRRSEAPEDFGENTSLPSTCARLF